MTGLRQRRGVRPLGNVGILVDLSLPLGESGVCSRALDGAAQSHLLVDHGLLQPSQRSELRVVVGPLLTVLILAVVVADMRHRKAVALLPVESLVDFGVHVHPIDRLSAVLVLQSLGSSLGTIPVLDPLGVVPLADGHV